MKIRTLLMVGGALFLVPLSVRAAERLDSDVSCRATDRNLVYDCTIVLKGKKSGEPIEGAEISIFADMPSMPMAHNVPPVTAKAASEPGVYRARLRIEMLGEWTLRLQISGSVRDLIVKSQGVSACPGTNRSADAGLVVAIGHDPDGRIVADARDATGETWRVWAADAYAAVCKLARRLGVDLADG